MFMPYHFEVLPLHPAFHRLESYTGYLIRLAQANGIDSVDELSSVFFPTQNRRITREIADYPSLSMGRLSTISMCSEASLRAMTFHPLGAKFGRSRHPQALSRFLAGSVSSHLRYCPPCIAEYGYYMLPWRFTTLNGCMRHRCHLRDTCGHCGEPLPLLAAPLHIGECPNCLGDLRTCVAGQLDPHEWRRVIGRHYDVMFLLTANLQHGDHKEAARYIGWCLAGLRRTRGMLVVEMAERSGLTMSRVEGIERGNVLGRGASFANYLAYADELGITLRDVLTGAVDTDRSGVNEDWTAD